MTVTNIGTTCGVVFTILSDKLGRWRVLLLACVSNTLVALLQALSVNMTMYTVLAFFDGITEQVSNLCVRASWGVAQFDIILWSCVFRITKEQVLCTRACCDPVSRRGLLDVTAVWPNEQSSNAFRLLKLCH